MLRIARTLIFSALLTTLSTGLTSCRNNLVLTQKRTEVQAARIKKGMTMAEVRKMFGRPMDRLIIVKDDTETWKYYRVDLMLTETKVISIDFEGGRVKRVDTYRYK